jgi:hypothetical protein
MNYIQQIKIRNKMGDSGFNYRATYFSKKPAVFFRESVYGYGFPFAENAIKTKKRI